MTKDERKTKRAADRALYRSLATQLLLLAMNSSSKPERYLAAAASCDEVSIRLRERATET